MIRYELRDDAVAVLVWDNESQSANVLSKDNIEQFAELTRQAIANPKVVGVVVASAKRDFLAGADLTKILPGTMSPEEYQHQIMRFHRYWRDIETGGKPFVAALNGSVLGGGYELALSCHRRIATNNPKTRIGLPEVSLALIPGGGGTQRLPRLIGPKAALPLIAQGRTVTVDEALALGMIDEVVPAEELIERACQWVREAGASGSVQPWDGQSINPSFADELEEVVSETQAKVRARTLGLQNAPERAIACVRDGFALSIDNALQLETEHFVASCFDPQALNTIRTSFFGVGAARKLVSRPAGVPERVFKKIGVLGAGMMGGGIAQVAAANGLQVVMLDATGEQAQKGKDKVGANLQRQVARGGMDQAQVDSILGRIQPTADVQDMADVDIVVEAVFENRDVKADITKRVTAVLPEGTIFASNTSTLPITGLAEASDKPDLFIGMHFFSPVDRMALVEIILGEQTSDTALAHSLDLIKTLRKVPIVVRDGRGFYTSRVFATYIYEALEMLEEGVSAEIIEEGGRLAGFPMSPLALSDQLSIELAYKVQKQERIDLGDAFNETAAYRVPKMMVDELGRPGRLGGGGYYDYPQDGEKTIWPGLAQRFSPLPKQPTAQDVAERFLTIQSVETLRSLDEGVLLRAIDGDIGAVLGWGYPAFRGGPIAYVDTVGLSKFLAQCHTYEQRYGARYAVPRTLLDRLTRGTTIYSKDPSALS